MYQVTMSATIYAVSTCHSGELNPCNDSHAVIVLETKLTVYFVTRTVIECGLHHGYIALYWLIRASQTELYDVCIYHVSYLYE